MSKFTFKSIRIIAARRLNCVPKQTADFSSCQILELHVEVNIYIARMTKAVYLWGESQRKYIII